MIFKQVFDQKSSTYTYLIASSKGREALIIDPVLENVSDYIILLKELDLRLVKVNEKARKPSLVVKVDFGKEIGIKQSSAQITHYYTPENLVGKQVIGVCNFPTKNIAGVTSEVLVLGAIEKDGKVVLVHPSQKTDNGLDIA